MKTQWIRAVVALILSIGIIINTQAQDADELFESGKYRLAANEYVALATSNPENYQDAAKSYTALKEWNKAIEMYEKYRDQYSRSDKAMINKVINLLRAEERELFVDNLGINVNSQYDEGSPRVSADGNKLYFFSGDRPGGKGNEDVWVSSRGANGEWQTPVNMPSPVNSSGNEALEATNADGSLMILFGNYDGAFGGGDLFYSAITNGQWTVPCNIGGGVNSEYWEVDATITPDGKTMYFTSQEHRMTGKDPDVEWYDIYVTHLRNGEWTEPIPLPSVINVKDGDERAPYISSDGRTLYFSSTSHAGFGGYDLFMTKRVGDDWSNWTTPVNLGKEINTVMNDLYISVPAVGSTLYFTRETTGEGDGFGGSDLFRMILPPELRPNPVVSIYGTVQNQDEEPIKSTLYWSDFDTGEQLGYSTSNAENGEYYITLPFGRRYLITANQKGFLFQTEMLDLKSVQDDTVAFSEKLGVERMRMQNALDRIESLSNEYEMLLNRSSSNLEADFDRLADLSKRMNQAQADLNASIRRARINWLEGNSGFQEVEKDIRLTEASEGARIVLENIYFDTGSDNLRSESQQELDRLYEIMSKSTLVIEIGGHTDDVGSDENNMNLSQNRAQAVVSYVIDKGIPTNRISAKGYGETEPRATNDNPEGRQENRRVEVKVLSSGAQEGTGDVLEQQAEEEAAALTNENLYELYRRAAIAGGVPSGAACYDTNNYSNANSNTQVNTVATTSTPRTRTPRTTSNSWFIDSDGNDISAFGGSSINFISHTGGGAHNLSIISGAGVLFQNGSGTGERNIYGYFLGDALGGGIDWIRFKDISSLTKLPISFDYGLSAYLVFNKDERTTFIGTKYDYFSTSWGAPIMARLRYNLEISDIKISPYASYNYNLLSLADIETDNKTEGSEVYSLGVIGSPTWLEIGARAQWKFLTGGLGIQNGGDTSGAMLRVGFAF